MVKIGFIGTGNMGSALIGAIYNKGFSREIIAFDPNKEKLIALENKYRIKKAKSNLEVVDYAEIIFLAVKPPLVETVLEEIKEHTHKEQLFISIAAGIKLERMEKKLPLSKIVRVMPNTPCFVSETAAGFALGKNCTKEDGKLVKRILDSAGISFELKEEQLDAVTGLSGSGPAFVAYLIQGFIEAGKKVGLPEEIATPLARQTFLGTAKLLKETDIDEESLKRMVTTPGGTTEAGRKILEDSEIKEVIIKTIKAATERSRELGKK